jgi:hypothetical protein
MTPFESQLLRLKELLRVTKDREVAEALGMSPAAFSYRKVQGHFPEEQLMGLNARRPEIDPYYVLFGQRRNDPSGTARPVTAEGIAIARAFHEWSLDALLADAVKHPWIQSLLVTLYCASDGTMARTLSYARQLMQADQLRGVMPRPFTQRLPYGQEALTEAAPASQATQTPAKATKRRTEPPEGGLA